MLFFAAHKVFTKRSMARIMGDWKVTNFSDAKCKRGEMAELSIISGTLASILFVLKSKIVWLFSRHAFLEKTRSIFLVCASHQRWASSSHRCNWRRWSESSGRWCRCLASIHASCVEAINRFCVIGCSSSRAARDTWMFSLDDICRWFITIFLQHHTLSCWKRFEAWHYDIVHDFILTAERCWWDACQLFLIVERLLAAVIQCIAIRFCRVYEFLDT